MDAIDAFDLGRGVNFETYCVPRIRGAMLDELRPWTGCRACAQQGQQARRSRKTLEAEFGRPPAPTKCGQTRVAACRNSKRCGRRHRRHLVSLNKKWYETDSYKDVREIDILEDKKAEDTHAAAFRTAT